MKLSDTSPPHRTATITRHKMEIPPGYLGIELPFRYRIIPESVGLPLLLIADHESISIEGVPISCEFLKKFLGGGVPEDRVYAFKHATRVGTSEIDIKSLVTIDQCASFFYGLEKSTNGVPGVETDVTPSPIILTEGARDDLKDSAPSLTGGIRQAIMTR